MYKFSSHYSSLATSTFYPHVMVSASKTNYNGRCDMYDTLVNVWAYVSFYYQYTQCNTFYTNREDYVYMVKYVYCSFIATCFNFLSQQV